MISFEPDPIDANTNEEQFVQFKSLLEQWIGCAAGSPLPYDLHPKAPAEPQPDRLRDHPREMKVYWALVEQFPELCLTSGIEDFLHRGDLVSCRTGRSEVLIARKELESDKLFAVEQVDGSWSLEWRDRNGTTSDRLICSLGDYLLGVGMHSLCEEEYWNSDDIVQGVAAESRLIFKTPWNGTEFFAHSRGLLYYIRTTREVAVSCRTPEVSEWFNPMTDFREGLVALVEELKRKQETNKAIHTDPSVG
ncbi:MAG: hypothetical protein ACI8UO_004999 [Verrucomicrobiales bacterium]|jgi:hypothetical protein